MLQVPGTSARPAQQCCGGRIVDNLFGLRIVTDLSSQPTPIQPMVIRSLGATVPSLPSAEELMTYGNPITPTAVPAALLRN